MPIKRFEIAGRGVDSLRAELSKLTDSQLEFGRPPQDHEFRLSITDLAGMRLVDIVFGTASEGETVPVTAYYLVSSNNSGKSLFEVCKVDVHAGSALPCEMHQQIPREADTGKTTVVVPQDMLHGYLGHLTGRPAGDTISFRIEAVDPGFARRWMSFMAYLDATIASGRLSASGASLIEDQLLTLLLEHQQDSHQALVQQRAPSIQPYVLREAQRFIEREAHRPLSIRDIAAAAGCSIRGLQRAFEEHLGTTPRNYLATKRLELARDALATAGPQTTVTSVAVGLGFTHLGQFAAAFRARFGLSPREVLRTEASASGHTGAVIEHLRDCVGLLC